MIICHVRKVQCRILKQLAWLIFSFSQYIIYSLAKVSDIGIHSEPIRTIPIHSDIYIRANANHSEQIRKTFCISFDEKRVKNRPNLIRFNPRQLSKWIRANPNQSELELIKTEFSIRAQIDWDWCRLKSWFRIHSDWCLWINRIRSDRFFTVFYQTSHKMFFGLVRNDSHWLVYRYRNESE